MIHAFCNIFVDNTSTLLNCNEAQNSSSSFLQIIEMGTSIYTLGIMIS